MTDPAKCVVVCCRKLGNLVKAVNISGGKKGQIQRYSKRSNVMLYSKKSVTLLGSSTYNTPEIFRLLEQHKTFEITSFCDDINFDKEVQELYPSLCNSKNAQLRVQDLSHRNINQSDCIICCLNKDKAINLFSENRYEQFTVDLSGAFRLKNQRLSITQESFNEKSVYGISELYREQIRQTNFVANPGCYPTASLLCLVPLLKSNLIQSDDIIIDGKAGVGGTGRKAQQNFLFSEINEGVNPYSFHQHKHVFEIEQVIYEQCQKQIKITFIPHFIPMIRGTLVTIYVKLENGVSVQDIKQHLQATYQNETFVKVLSNNQAPTNRDVKGSNFCNINVFEHRCQQRAIIVSTIDNLVKGSAGQAVQNLNIMHGLNEIEGLQFQPFYP